MKWGDLISLEYGKPVQDKDRTDGKYPVFGTNGQIGTTNLLPLCNHPSMILGRKGAYRGVHYSDGPCSVIDTAFYTELRSNKVDMKWVYYKFLTYDINQMDTGSAIPSTDRYEIYSMDVEVPPIEVQRQAVHELEILDQKIRVNKKINDNLQQQAQAIYTLFFVKNADVSWAKGHLSNLVNIKYGKDHKNLSDGIYPVYGSGGIIRHAEKFLYDKESVLIPRKGTLNNVMYVNQPFWSVDTMFYTEMKLPNIAKFVFHFIKSKDLDALNEGSAVPSMTTSLLNAMEVLIPPQPILKRFEAIVSPMYNIMQKNAEQNKTLSGLRNCLLFPLITNQIHF